MPDCAHNVFDAQVSVIRLTDDGGTVTGYQAEVRIHCEECGTPFEFLGLPPGCDTQGAAVSIDGQEALLAIAAKGTKPNPLHRLRYGIGSFDG